MTIGGEAEAVTLGTEAIRHGTDEAQRPGRIRELVIPGRPVTGRRQVGFELTEGALDR